jgi:hypothetical protein
MAFASLCATDRKERARIESKSAASASWRMLRGEQSLVGEVTVADVFSRRADSVRESAREDAADASAAATSSKIWEP